MTDRTCTLPDCDAPLLAKGFCGPHYRRNAAHGDPYASPGTGQLSPSITSVTCVVEGCGKPARTSKRPLCRSHNQLYVRTGSTDPIVGTLERFMKFVRKQDDGCWIWTGSVMGDGDYGQFSMKATGRRTIYAHRMSWELLRGPIPDGLTIDHLCMVKMCVNPAHLEPVTQKVNNRRYTALRTHCPQGHEYSEANTYTYKGARGCRTCHRERTRAARARRAKSKLVNHALGPQPTR